MEQTERPAFSPPAGRRAGTDRAKTQGWNFEESVVADLATSQRGVVHRRQLLDLGMSPRTIGRRVERGSLHAVGQDVYAVGHRALGRLGRVSAAVLAAGPDRIAVSHISAARAWGLVEHAIDGPIHVSALDRRHLSLPAGTVLHRPRSLERDQVTMHRGAPMTVPERTVCDLLPTSTTEEVTRLLEQMVLVLGRSPDELHAWGATVGPVRGRPRLTEALDHVVSPAVLRSRLEREFRSLCQAAGLPIAQTNARFGRWEVDVLFEDEMVVIELDGFRYHRGRWQFDRDRTKALDLAGLGYEVIRLTWFQVRHEQRRVAQILGDVLDRRRATVRRR